MTGYHHGRNVLACAPVARPPLPKFVDTGTQRFGMHACPAGAPVSGINDGRGLLLCGTQSGLRIQSFKALPNDGYIRVGDSATLTWQVSGCEVNCSVSLQGREGLGNLVLDMPYVPPTGSQQVTPRFNTTYTLTAITTGGDRDSREKEVRLYGGTPTGSLFYFKMTSPQSWVTPCKTITIYAPDQTTAKKTRIAN